MTPIEKAYTNLVERSIVKPWDYSNCPLCQKLKSKRSKLCIFCLRKGRPPIEQPDDLSIRYIPLTQNKLSVVDASDYEFYMQWKWCAVFIPIMDSFYALRRGADRKALLMHRHILGLEFGDPRQGDHVDGDTLNNRRGNLRIATQSQNLVNKRRQRNNTSGFNGVDYMKRDNKWRSRVKKDGKEIWTAYFDTKEEARDAQIEKAKEIHGEFVPNRK